MLSIPKGFIEKSCETFPNGDKILRGMYETEDGVDERCIVMYANKRIYMIYLLEEDVCLTE